MGLESDEMREYVGDRVEDIPSGSAEYSANGAGNGGGEERQRQNHETGSDLYMSLGGGGGEGRRGERTLSEVSLAPRLIGAYLSCSACTYGHTQNTCSCTRLSECGCACSRVHVRARVCACVA